MAGGTDDGANERTAEGWFQSVSNTDNITRDDFLTERGVSSSFAHQPFRAFLILTNNFKQV